LPRRQRAYPSVGLDEWHQTDVERPAGQVKKSTRRSDLTPTCWVKDTTFRHRAQKRCVTGLTATAGLDTLRSTIFNKVSPVSRLGRIAVSTSIAALGLRGLMLGTLISTTTGMTITGPSRAGTG